MKRIVPKIIGLMLIIIISTMIGGKIMSEKLYGYCGSKCKHEVYSKSDVYSKSETYSKSEVYSKSDVYKKSETYSKTEIDGKFALVTGTVTMPAGQIKVSTDNITFPSGFTSSNSVVSSIGWGQNNILTYGYYQNSGEVMTGASVTYRSSSFYLTLRLGSSSESARTYDYKVLLMKTS
jgi:hypothetical protein